MDICLWYCLSFYDVDVIVVTRFCCKCVVAVSSHWRGNMLTLNIPLS